MRTLIASAGSAPADQILDEHVARCHVVRHVVIKRVERLGGHRGVVVPPDDVAGQVGFHHVLVLGRATGEIAGADKKRPALSKRALAPLQRRLDQRRLDEVVMDIAQTGDALILQPEPRVDPSECHDALLLCVTTAPAASECAPQ